MDMSQLSLCAAAQNIRQGTFTSEDYVLALLRRCEQAKQLNAFLYMDAAQVLDDARQADRQMRSGQISGPLHGVPIAIKDNFDVIGTATTAGTPALADNIAVKTSPVVQRLFDAGAIMLGKTNMYELAFGITSSNEWTGATLNPYDPTRSAGGSSGGTAAAVAARLAPAGLGSDTAGSVRIPAAHCGIFGFRPSTGRYPNDGIVPLFHSRDTAGLMARSVDDLIVMDTLITGETATSIENLAGLRIGVPRRRHFSGLDHGIAAAIETELDRLSELGVILVDADLPDHLLDSSFAIETLREWELRRDMEAYLGRSSLSLDFDGLISAVKGEYVKREFETGLKAADDPDLENRYRTVISKTLPAYRAGYRAFFEENGISAIAFPTSPLAPTPIEDNGMTLCNGAPVSVWRTLRNTAPASMFGAPGLSVPVGLNGDGLPVGLEFDGLPGSDGHLLAIGAAWERFSPKIAAPELSASLP
ncbi:MAG: amidase family protein [Alphaproteobacteria bacterium]|nr:amidase family protein [Alphaproteobacteria bacterium]